MQPDVLSPPTPDHATPGLGDLLATAAARWPDQPAWHAGEETLDFQTLYQRAQQDASQLHGTPGILRQHGSHRELARLSYAAALAGRPFWPQAPEGSADRLPAPQHPPAGTELIISTSGSAGDAKAVCLSRGNLLAAAQASNHVLPLRPGDCWLACLPFHHIASQSILRRCLLAGASVEIHDRFSTQAIATALASGRITHLSLVPTMLARLLEDGVAPGPLRFALIGGAALSAPLFAAARQAGWPLIPSYGMSESSAQIASLLPEHGPWQAGLVGPLLPGVEIRIDAGQRILLRGRQIMTGYLGAPDHGRDAEGWLPTSDLGWLDARGHLHLLGRADAMINSGGEKVHPQAIENCLQGCPGVREIAILGEADPLWGERVVALFCGTASETSLHDWSRQHLPPASRPRRYLRRASLPRNALGKHDQPALQAMLCHPWPSMAEIEQLLAGLHALTVDHRPNGLLSFSLPSPESPENWLARLPEDRPFWYAADPQTDQSHLGLGAALHLDSQGSGRFAALNDAWLGLRDHWQHTVLDQTTDAPAPLACLGFAFDEHAGPEQLLGLPNALFAVPSLLLRRVGTHQRLILTCTRQAASAPQSQIDHWLSLFETLSRPERPATASQFPLPADAPTTEQWNARVQAALQDIAHGPLQKVVLSRRVRHARPPRCTAAHVLTQLTERHTHCRRYAFGDGQQIFLGATPERLIRLQNGQAEADALAGTSWQQPAAGTPGRPLSDAKNTHEQDVVVVAVQAALARCCTHMNAPTPPTVLELPGLAHWHTRITGQAQPGVTLFDLIAHLHPTPAIGGMPRQAAIDWLRQHGEQRPAWYGGGIGWIDQYGNGDIAVALRCAVLRGPQALLAAGAGIVPDAQAEQEWMETEAKMHALRQLLTESLSEEETSHVRHA